ncbi:hypothetical protein [Chitinivibrio alkaliphilus]|uniref:Uncharacterized protein n=1 Tax=Chitinivibrio alkaliphilus ACht1 TaxID=1313304 RepID=U7D7T1_9BACT|nr:hypothetical protein [Chitinivibrio alkaliphilus]ERP31152.1 hypothetical protein CALK_1950 [Chitinivibrio alkaliphilus ACht1]
MITGQLHKTVGSVRWQDYRCNDTGVVVYYESDKDSELPIRKVSVKNPTDAVFDPNYETRTYGFYGCDSSSLRNSFVKQRMGYVFFMTRYKGTIQKLSNKLMITGYYKIGQNYEVQNLHLRCLEKYTCFNGKQCQALLAKEAVFLSPEEAYQLTAASLKSLGYEKKVTRMTKIELSQEQVKKVLKKFEGKHNCITEYSDTTQELLQEVY